MRMEALKSAGVDVSNYYTLGADKLVRIEKGEAIPVDLDDVVVDAVGKKIVEGGYVNNWKLFRRWVTAQIFGMLRDMKTGKKSFNELLQRKGYEYQWRMLENEFHAQAKMQENGDTENLSKRGIFFNECTFSGMVDDYIEKLKAYVNDNLIFRKDKNGVNTKAYKHKCKGVPYVRLNNKDIFVADLMKKVYVPLYKIARDGLTQRTDENSTTSLRSSTRFASTSHGKPSSPTRSSTPIRVRVLTSQCVTSLCSARLALQASPKRHLSAR